MSLTSFLSDDGELRILLDQTFPKPEFAMEVPRRAEPQTRNYALIGTAFDYVLRFWLERQYPDAETKPWVAHQGLQLAQALPMDPATPEGQSLESFLDAIEERHAAYLESGEMTDELLGGTLDLARFDWVYRSGRPPESLGEHAEGDLADLRQLLAIIPEAEFRGADSVLLNPTFGDASRLVNGADADLVFDGLLLDIKTVKDLSLKVGYWRQLVGYAVLTDLAADDTTVPSQFDEIGVYFARHGALWRTATDAIYGHPKYDQFADWFRERATEHFGGDFPGA
ncbi:hypothetical protein [Halosegnis marinus]|uniref:PD-(D/E)XK endonuclease-like domain-containing protein n=2 Tax=Halosegnis marinus TaxID=3034023 RepID=A0ABD5ZSQ2_9EURY|nr:hypothetical protein [Halosegnis sp. DT85]